MFLNHTQQCSGVASASILRNKLAELRGPYGRPRFEPESAVGKASPFPVCSIILGPHFSELLFLFLPYLAMFSVSFRLCAQVLLLAVLGTIWD